MAVELDKVVARLDAWAWERDWVGADPYEGLNAGRARWLKRTPLGRRVLIQAVKRSPVNLRTALAIEPRHNAAAIGHALSATARLRTIGEGERRRRIDRLAEILEPLRAPGFDEPCWGYPFDVETRVFFYPAASPNTIATAFCGLGLLDAHAATGDERLLELAVGCGRFLRRHLPPTAAEVGAFIGYIPGDRTPIHNASLLAAGLLARLAGEAGEEQHAASARGAVEYALSRQRADGAWPYAEQPGLEWIDGHHTGYVLDSLLRCESLVGAERVRPAWKRGLDYYRRALFLEDGTPKYMSDSLYPIDVQCAAQGIATFALGAPHDGGGVAQASRVLRATDRRLGRGDGAFAFQRTRFWRNPVALMRWGQAPMLDALTLLRTRLPEA